MLFKIAIALLLVWVLGLTGAYSIGKSYHLLLLTALMLALLSFARARDAGLENARRKNDRP